MNDNNKQFERLSFWQLLTKISIEIPIIQRDYAQGRENQQKIRDKFLTSLYYALTEKPVELDFIYGSEDNYTLQPLDGQQRLTTLFLLHWYIATKENKIDDLQNQLEIRDEKNEITKRKFSYETRTSSREFCNELTANHIDFNNLLTTDADKKGQSKNNELSKTIINSAWFVASWEKDPTISAMLIMLDAIHFKFKDTSELWDKLIDEQNPSITFLYIKLENFGLSDDLYIKMNARGKQLTEFENFKSQFEKHIEINKFEDGIANPEEQFAHKIDTIWTDLFWQYKEKQKDNSYSLDTNLINFIAGTAINYYAVALEIAENKEEIESIKNELSDKGRIKDVTDEVIKKERIERRIQQLANKPKEVIPEDFPTKEAFKYLVNCFNKYSCKQNNAFGYSNLKPEFDLWGYCKSTIFKDFIQYSKPEYKSRILFYAQTIYLLKNDFDTNSYSDWLRVVRNIVENSSIEHPSDFISAINLVQELSSGCSEIYTYLANNEVSAGHAKEQVKEEIEKAKITIANQYNKQVIHETEDANFCKGKIDFAFYCIDYDNTNISTFAVSELEKVKNVFVNYLNTDDVSNDFRRALFTIQDTLFYNYWWSWLNVVSADKRCIIENTSDLKGNFTKKDNWSKYLKDLILKLCTETIDKIIDEFVKTQDFPNLPHWKQRIINEKGLLEHSHSHYIAIPRDESRCWLIPYSRVANNSEGKKKLKEIK
jgi:hypothetical protein